MNIEHEPQIGSFEPDLKEARGHHIHASDQ